MALFTTALGLYGGVLRSGELQGFILHERVPTGGVLPLHVGAVRFVGLWDAVPTYVVGRATPGPRPGAQGCSLSGYMGRGPYVGRGAMWNYIARELRIALCCCQLVA
jgi:hypothetical protein